MSDIDRLLDIMRRLREPDGCPWDREQDFASIAPFTIEEAYEVADAIERGDLEALRGELGDLLFQVVFHSQLAAEQGAFAFADVVQAIADKLERRHPHVFGDAAVDNAAEQTRHWEAIKAAEREAAGGDSSALADVPATLPALSRAAKLTRRAARVGFDWPDYHGALAKIREELDELEEAIGEQDQDAVEDELGDLFFALVNVARQLRIDPERAVERTNRKFERRFRAVEGKLAAQGKRPEQSNLEEMDALWNQVKREQG